MTNLVGGCAAEQFGRNNWRTTLGLKEKKQCFFGAELVSPKQRCGAADSAVWEQLWFGFSLGSEPSRFHSQAPGWRPLPSFLPSVFEKQPPWPSWGGSLPNWFLRKQKLWVFSERCTCVPGHLLTNPVYSGFPPLKHPAKWPWSQLIVMTPVEFSTFFFFYFMSKFSLNS